jgi:phage FluMu protein Com
MNAVVKKLVVSRKMAANGVDFSARLGVKCPWCRRKTRITATRPWEENTRIRYHRCTNPRCPISTMNVNIKSIEVDDTPDSYDGDLAW